MLAQILGFAAVQVLAFFVLWFLLKARIRTLMDLGNLLEESRKETGILINELNAAADRSVRLLEDKAQTVTELIEEADKRTTIARRELENRVYERHTYDRLAKARTIQGSLPAGEVAPRPFLAQDSLLHPAKNNSGQDTNPALSKNSQAANDLASSLHGEDNGRSGGKNTVHSDGNGQSSKVRQDAGQDVRQEAGQDDRRGAERNATKKTAQSYSMESSNLASHKVPETLSPDSLKAGQGAAGQESGPSFAPDALPDSRRTINQDIALAGAHSASRESATPDSQNGIKDMATRAGKKKLPASQKQKGRADPAGSKEDDNNAKEAAEVRLGDAAKLEAHATGEKLNALGAAHENAQKARHLSSQFAHDDGSQAHSGEHAYPAMPEIVSRIEENSVRKDVLELNQQGYSLEKIAKKLGISLAEVELITQIADLTRKVRLSKKD